MTYSVYSFFTTDEIERSWLISILSDYHFDGFEETEESLKAYAPSDKIKHLQVRKEEQQNTYVTKQLQESLFVFSAEEISQITIAYEPIWAIGTGLNATSQQAQDMHSFIRSQIAATYSKQLADQTRILYGGSCKPDNARELFSCPDVDGGLIGGASLKASDFLGIIEKAG